MNNSEGKKTAQGKASLAMFVILELRLTHHTALVR